VNQRETLCNLSESWEFHTVNGIWFYPQKRRHAAGQAKLLWRLIQIWDLWLICHGSSPEKSKEDPIQHNQEILNKLLV